MESISFYLAHEEVEKMLFNLLLKMIEKGNKVLIFCESEERLKKLDDTLWLLGRTKFLPHGKQGDGYEEKQPVFLTTKEENPNNANFLFLFGEPSENFIKQFPKAFYIFARKEYVSSKEKWDRYKQRGDFKLIFNKMEGGKWVSGEELVL
ncbi:DNA polymerase III subunit chi [Pseudomonadota bacterium]